MANLGYVGLGVMGGRMADRMVTDSTALDKTKAAGFPIIFVTDPWGTYIELTEGLDKVQ